MRQNMERGVFLLSDSSQHLRERKRKEKRVSVYVYATDVLLWKCADFSSNLADTHVITIYAHTFFALSQTPSPNIGDRLTSVTKVDGRETAVTKRLHVLLERNKGGKR